MAQRKQVFDGIIQLRFAKLNTEPFFLVHVIGRIIAVLPAKRADQQRIAFHIKDINDACLRQSQLISRYFQNYTIPFIIVVVPQHRIPVMPGVFRLCAVLLAYLLVVSLHRFPAVLCVVLYNNLLHKFLPQITLHDRLRICSKKVVTINVQRLFRCI